MTVRVIDAREVYGRTDYLVQPQVGSGQQWVSAERVNLTVAESTDDDERLTLHADPAARPLSLHAV